MEQNFDRDARTETRVPFHALVEVGGAVGGFVAQAVDVSIEGMHLKTAYLPDMGQVLTCRFEAGGINVEVHGDVVWREEHARGGDFGLRFRDLNENSVLALRRIMACEAPPVVAAPQAAVGERVRLHIDGLSAPMRGRVKDVAADSVAIGSDLSFLRLGKTLEIEDAVTGNRRTATIDHVGLSVDAVSHVPELVVALQYEADASLASNASNVPSMPNMIDRTDAIDMADEVRVSEAEAASIGAPRITPGGFAPGSVPNSQAPNSPPRGYAPPGSGAVPRSGEGVRLASMAAHAARAAEKMGEIASRAAQSMASLPSLPWREKFGVASEPARRVTAPPPGGALHSDGRRVVRDDRDSEYWDNERAEASVRRSRTRLIAVGAVSLATVALAAYAFHTPTPATTASTVTAPAANDVPATPVTDPSAVVVAPDAPRTASTDGLIVHAAPTAAVLPGALPSSAQPSALPSSQLPGTPSAPVAAEGQVTAPPSPTAMLTLPQQTAFPKPGAATLLGEPASFGNGPVGRGVTLRIKMDGPIGQIQGAHEATGFVVQVPDRRNEKPTEGLALRDSRIAAMHMTNTDTGSELKVAFRNGVPNYQVRARGDVLEVVVAGRPGAKHVKHHRTHAAPRKHKGHHGVSLGRTHHKKHGHRS